MAKQTLSMSEIIESHKPKNYKYKYIINDDDVLRQLESEGYDLEQLDTIRMDHVTHAALECEFQVYDRTLIKKAKEPTIMTDGVVINKKMITKTDKKLLSIRIGNFAYDSMQYLCVMFDYERFSIMELFVKI